MCVCEMTPKSGVLGSRDGSCQAGTAKGEKDQLWMEYCTIAPSHKLVTSVARQQPTYIQISNP